MEHADDIDTRLTNLEIKSSFTEDLVDGLNTALFRQQEQIDMLLRELARLRRQAATGSASPMRTAADDLPPHY